MRCVPTCIQCKGPGCTSLLTFYVRTADWHRTHKCRQHELFTTDTATHPLGCSPVVSAQFTLLHGAGWRWRPLPAAAQPLHTAAWRFFVPALCHIPAHEAHHKLGALSSCIQRQCLLGRTWLPREHLRIMPAFDRAMWGMVLAAECAVYLRAYCLPSTCLVFQIVKPVLPFCSLSYFWASRSTGVRSLAGQQCMPPWTSQSQGLCTSQASAGRSCTTPSTLTWMQKTTCEPA